MTKLKLSDTYSGSSTMWLPDLTISHLNICFEFPSKDLRPISTYLQLMDIYAKDVQGLQNFKQQLLNEMRGGLGGTRVHKWAVKGRSVAIPLVQMGCIQQRGNTDTSGDILPGNRWTH